MSNCSNWFRTMVEFRNTVKAWAVTYELSTAIAKHVQSIVVHGATQKQVEEVVKASNELCEQIGF